MYGNTQPPSFAVETPRATHVTPLSAQMSATSAIGSLPTTRATDTALADDDDDIEDDADALNAAAAFPEIIPSFRRLAASVSLRSCRVTRTLLTPNCAASIVRGTASRRS